MTISERYIQITKHLCQDKNPSTFLNMLMAEGAFSCYPFYMLTDMQKTPQSPIYHPEGNVWNHTCLVVDEAAKMREQSANPIVFMWAALLHDIGKPSTTKKRRGKYTSYDHEKVGMQLTVEFLSVLTEDIEFIQQVSQLVRFHMQPLFVLKDLPFAELDYMVKQTNVDEIALLGFCDRMGRGNSNYAKEKSNKQAFLNKCNAHEYRHQPTM